jgi:EasF-like predicted methyltransferase
MAVSIILNEEEEEQKTVLPIKSVKVIPLGAWEDSSCSRPAGSIDLKTELLTGIQANPPHLPSLLLWDDHGIRQFNALTLHPNYYPSRTELGLVTRYADEMAATMPPHGVLIELGCGSLRKTSIILSAFDQLRRPVTYYALDVSAAELATNLESLSQRFAHSDCVTIHGLHGNYDDCARWLASSPPFLTPGQVVSFLWIGNSIANMHPPEASGLLAKFRQACTGESRLQCRFLISSDACGDPATVLHSYSPSYEAHTNFLFNGLDSANRVLGANVFRSEDFRCETEFDVHNRLLQVYYVANRRLQLSILDATGNAVVLEEGQKVPIIHSYKWSKDDMSRICADAGLQATQMWKDNQVDYCKWPFC